MEKIIVEFDYMYKDDIVSHIKAVEVSSGSIEVHVTNFTKCNFRKMFGVHESVGYGDLERVLESRCFPKERSNCAELLEDLGLKVYNPLAIVRITHGLLSSDCFWIRFNDESNLSYNKARELVDL